MDARHLTLLRELRDRGSVHAVAAASHRTPSAVSQQLRTAAREIGGALVEADGRGVRLTDLGLLLADGATEVEVALARVQARVDDFRGEVAGMVTVTALPSAAEILLPRVVAELAVAYPRVRVAITDHDVAEPDLATLTQDFDVVVGHSLTGRSPRGADQLARAVLAREPLDVALPAGHRLAAQEVVSPADVVDEPWIAVPAGYPFATVLEGIERVSRREIRVVQEVRDNRLVAALVRTGVGIAVLPRFTTTEDDGLVLRPLSRVPSRRWVVASSRRDRAERRSVQAVVRALRQVGREVEVEHTA